MGETLKTDATNNPHAWSTSGLLSEAPLRGSAKAQAPNQAGQLSWQEPTSLDAKVIKLEIENLRLQKLVTELLVKNQELRDRHAKQSGAAPAYLSPGNW